MSAVSVRRDASWTTLRSTNALRRASVQSMSQEPTPREDPKQTRRDLKAALIFGVVAATLELAALLYFFR